MIVHETNLHPSSLNKVLIFGHLELYIEVINSDGASKIT